MSLVIYIYSICTPLFNTIIFLAINSTLFWIILDTDISLYIMTDNILDITSNYCLVSTRNNTIK